jgi:hypothetical protein
MVLRKDKKDKVEIGNSGSGPITPKSSSGEGEEEKRCESYLRISFSTPGPIALAGQKQRRDD